MAMGGEVEINTIPGYLPQRITAPQHAGDFDTHALRLVILFDAQGAATGSAAVIEHQICGFFRHPYPAPWRVNLSRSQQRSKPAAAAPGRNKRESQWLAAGSG
jgi:hypothetical protein